MGRLRPSWRRPGVALLVSLVLLAGCSAGPASTGDPVGGSSTATGRVTIAPSAATVLHPAVGFGLLRVMSLDQRPNPRDVVVYAALPNELPRVAGVITTVAQTPLSHVNLRAVQDDVPNAVVPGALDDPAVQALVGRYVRYSAGPDGVSVAPATQAEVEAHHAAARPATAQVPERDLTVRAVTPLSQIGFTDWRTFGVKAANLATLATFGLTEAEVPDGFAVPFSFYDEFMRTNGLYDRVRSLLADDRFRSDPAVQDAKLAALRDTIEAAPMPAWMERALATTRAAFPPGTAIRCRSSTNNEDLPDFSGAGLYDSFTQHPDEGPLTKCVKQVFASVWNLRAYLERDFYRIDHLATAMGVLLIPAFEGERANGVAVSADPVYDTPGAYYVNAQVGEVLVTNPDVRSVPEELLVWPDGTVAVAARSNLVEPGGRVLDDRQAAALRATLAVIADRFAALYRPDPGERFAMEVEFKITAAGRLSVKQARTWIFS